MKSRIVALALAAVMTLGSCMSASAKEVFTKGMIGATEVKNGAYVQSIDLIDITLWETANKFAYDVTQIVQAGNTGAKDTIDGLNVIFNNTYGVSVQNLTTAEQDVLLSMIQSYGYNYVQNWNDNALTAPYKTAWSYKQWASRIQIAPYGERYIVALNYAKLYNDLLTVAKQLVAQGQITVSQAYANTDIYETAKKALNVADVKVALAKDTKTLSGATLTINGNTVKCAANETTPLNVEVAGRTYDIHRVINGVVSDNRVTTGEVPVALYTSYIAIPTSENYVASTFSYRTATSFVNVKVGTLSNLGMVDIDGSKTITFDGKDASIREILNATSVYGTPKFQENADNALEIASRLKASFQEAKDYYDGETKEGLAYLINHYRPDLGTLTKANIVDQNGFDLDPYNKLSWKLNETKQIAFTSPTIQAMKPTQQCVVLHYDTTLCKWEVLDAKFVNYGTANVQGIEAPFNSASPVIVVTLKDVADNGGAAAKATDAKKSPATGENF